MKAKLILSVALISMLFMGCGSVDCTTKFKTQTFDYSNFTPSGTKHTPVFDYSDICQPKKIEATLEVSKFEGGELNGSRLYVVLERSIDGVAWFSEEFSAIEIDMSGDPINTTQKLVILDDDFIGDKLRFTYWITAGEPVIIPSVADFKITTLVK